jgi:hypothetical protein
MQLRDRAEINDPIITKCTKENRACMGHDGKYCKERDPNLNLLCTRIKDHTGPHIACGGTTHNFQIWE